MLNLVADSGVILLVLGMGARFGRYGKIKTFEPPRMVQQLPDKRGQFFPTAFQINGKSSFLRKRNDDMCDIFTCPGIALRIRAKRKR